MLREQQALQSRWGAAEQIAAAERAQVLVSQGYGPLLQWLNHEGRHPGEQPLETDNGITLSTATRARRQNMADLFDAAA